jgi:hypothetical protein
MEILFAPNGLSEDILLKNIKKYPISSALDLAYMAR